MTGWRLRGLRTRLLVAFALLSVFTAMAVAGIGYVQARNGILQRTQDNAATEMTNQLKQLYPLPRQPVDTSALQSVADRLNGRKTAALVTSGGHSAGDMPASVITPELRAVVRSGRVAWQRVDVGGVTQLLLGSPLLISTGDRRNPTIPSGIEIYELRNLDAEIDAVNRLARDAWLAGGAALVVALILAVLAAGSVLRPVGELQRAARRLGAGDLDARIAVRGSDELASVAETFNATADSLQRHVGELRRMEADARRFVADVSHELRTPLAAMTAVTDMLDAEAKRLPDAAGEAVRLVSQETHNLTRLVNDLIEVTRFDSGTASLEVDDVDVAEAVRATLRARGFAVETDLPEGIRARVDPRRLDVIVANLVGNALRHGAEPVTVRLRGDQAGVTLTVEDSGSGLDEEVLPHVFSRFYKADTARSRSEGSGLGLAIAWENARLHQGELTAGNRPEGGAVFTLRLPREVRR
ncbi:MULTISPECIES: sensor histidine kinase [unclassified Amycolatopsis]|uniref:sensor histidine kinase n=1 Tax=unclassified Amycolatopsis TaxID=2618356 RepID=UPI00106E9FF1|nr:MULTISPECIES: sensor histidine kinase [unclassified Amycolatopsis]